MLETIQSWQDALASRTSLTEAQRRAVADQFNLHGHTEPYEIHLSDLGILDETSDPTLVVFPDVMRAEMMGGSRSLARFLHKNPELYRGKQAIDMGAGSGIQGVIMGNQGATRVIFSDISHDAYLNTYVNASRFRLDTNLVHEGDLFERITEPADIIVFNHPFFPATPIESIKVSRAMMDDGALIHRFLDEAKGYLRDGSIIMPFYHLAGEANDPAIQARKHGYVVSSEAHIQNTTGLQQGEFSIYELRLSGF